MDLQKLKEKIKEEEQWLRSTVIPEITKSKKCENSNDYEIKVDRIEIKFIGTEEAFMLTNCYRSNIEFYLKNETHQLCLVVKKTPELPADVYDSINFHTLFNNEIIAYSTIIPAIEHFIGRPFKVPKYYYSNLQKYFAAIALEDFGVEGWRVTKDRYNLSLEHIITAVKYLGEFHGIGFALREVQRKTFDSITFALREPRYEKESHEEWLLLGKVAIKRLIKVSREHEASVSEEFLAKFEKLLNAEPTYGKQRVRPREPFITLCHGDFLRNNIAFQYEEDANGTETPVKTMMFDLQTMQLSSPMMDLAVLLMLSAFTAVRHENFKTIFNSYCDALTQSYEAYVKKKAPAYFSHESLLREFIVFLPHGIQIASFFLPLIIEPDKTSSEDFLKAHPTPEEITYQAMSRGGEVVDRELSHQVKELFELVKQHQVDICKDIMY